MSFLWLHNNSHKMSICFYVTDTLVDVCVFDTCIHETIFNLLISISEVVSDGSETELLKNRSLLSLIF